MFKQKDWSKDINSIFDSRINGLRQEINQISKLEPHADLREYTDLSIVLYKTIARVAKEIFDSIHNKINSPDGETYGRELDDLKWRITMLEDKLKNK